MKQMTTRKLLSVFLVLALVLCIAPTVEAARTYEANDDDPRIAYHGNWTYYQDPAFYNGGEHFSGTAGDCAEFTFEGMGIEWIGATSNNLGLAYVLIDGEVQGSVIDLYSPTLETEKVLFSEWNLPNGEHTIRIYVAGGHHPSSTGSYVTIDAFEIVRSIDPSNPGVETSRVPEFDRVSDGGTVVSGTGVPDAEVTVYLPNESDIVRIVGPDGRWSVPSTILRTGQIVGAIQVERNKLPSAEVSITVGKPLPISGPPTIDDFVIGSNIHGAVSQGVVGHGIPGATIEVELPNGKTSTTIISASSSWMVVFPLNTFQNGDIITASQTEPGKQRSVKVQKTYVHSFL